MRLILNFFVLAIIAFFGFTSEGYAQQEKEEKVKKTFRQQFVDSTDNAFDVSTWMSEVYGVIPLATLITEPAVGYGVAGGLIRLSRKKKRSYNGGFIPPDVSLLGGMYTQNTSWAAVFAHQGYWKQDRIRFTGAVGYLSPILAVYREGLLGETRKYSFNLKGPLLVISASHRIKESGSFLGLQYLFMNNELIFDLPFEEIPFPPKDFTATLSGLGVLYSYDSRDNTFTPNNGIKTAISTMFYSEIIGSTAEYTRIDSYITGYKHVGKFVLGGRFDYRVALRDAPFYTLPYVMLRGVPAFRFQGKQVVILETEERWDFSRRWSLVGFAGVGQGFETLESFNNEELAYSLGGGIRYFIAKFFNLYGGVDVARGNEDWVFYIQFGHYWNGL